MFGDAGRGAGRMLKLLLSQNERYNVYSFYNASKLEYHFMSKLNYSVMFKMHDSFTWALNFRQTVNACMKNFINKY